MPHNADKDAPAFDPPDAETVYRNYLKTCGRLGVEPVARDRTQDLMAEWSAEIAASNAREHDLPATGQSVANWFSPIERSSTRDSTFFGCVLSLNNAVAEVRRALRKPSLAVVVNLIAGVVSTRALSLPGAFGVLLSMAATAQGLIASDQPASEAGPPIGTTMMQVVPYPYGMYALPDVAPAVPSCYRIGRCSGYDLYRFRDRPNWLTRLAPEAPPESVAEAAWIPYRWFLVPLTPEENILPPYRAASQVRDEYRDVGRPIDSPN